MNTIKHLLIILSILIPFSYGEACTSAIISGKVTKSGRPLLWKHRDTGEENNKVERIKARPGEMEYVALFNASDTNNNEAWMGMNTAGFAIMNTASYNIKNDTISTMDQEGALMSEALKACKSVDDFERFLIKHKKPLRVEANFGVIDAKGNGAYFETGNWGYKKYDLAKSEYGVLVRTNYCHSGRKDEGYGYVREQNAWNQLKPHIAAKDVTPATLTEELSRTFYHSMEDSDMSKCNLNWLIDQDFIPRYTSTATCVIEGVNGNEDPLLTTMWIGLGYPPCSEIRACSFGENGVPTELNGNLPNGHSILCDSVVARKKEIFPFTFDNGKKYINIKKLYNVDGTGYCQKLIPENLKYYESINKILDVRRKK